MKEIRSHIYESIRSGVKDALETYGEKEALRLMVEFYGVNRVNIFFKNAVSYSTLQNIVAGEDKFPVSAKICNRLNLCIRTWLREAVEEAA